MPETPEEKPEGKPEVKMSEPSSSSGRRTAVSNAKYEVESSTGPTTSVCGSAK